MDDMIEKVLMYGTIFLAWLELNHLYEYFIPYTGPDQSIWW